MIKLSVSIGYALQAFKVAGIKHYLQICDLIQLSTKLYKYLTITWEKSAS